MQLSVFFGRHAKVFFEQPIQVCQVGEVELSGNLRCGFSSGEQLVVEVFHRKGHTVIEQTFAGVLFDDTPQIRAIVTEKLCQLRVCDAAMPLTENAVNTRE